MKLPTEPTLPPRDFVPSFADGMSTSYVRQMLDDDDSAAGIRNTMAELLCRTFSTPAMVPSLESSVLM